MSCEHTTTSQRREITSARLMVALSALLNQARLLDDTAVPDDGPGAVEEDPDYTAALTAFKDMLEQLVNMAATLGAIAHEVPTRAGEAVMVMFYAQQHHEDALYAVVTASTKYSTLEDDMGRLRRECGRKIQDSARAAWVMNGNTEMSYKPIADTPLDKLAGDHADYVAHRQAMVEAKAELADASAHAGVCAGRAECARIMAQGFLAGARPFGPETDTDDEGAAAGRGEATTNAD